MKRLIWSDFGEKVAFFFLKTQEVLLAGLFVWLHGISTPAGNTMLNFIYTHIKPKISKCISKVGDRSRGPPEGSIFNSYYKGVGEGATPSIAPLYPWYVPYNAEY